VDTTLVITLTFIGSQSMTTIAKLIFSGYVLKVIYEVIATPLTYLVVNSLKRAEGVDVYDTETDFNPFGRERNQVEAAAGNPAIEAATGSGK